MLPGLLAAIQKDLRLLLRDRAGLVFLTVAPIVVITVAGLSLASLYGESPTGTSAYVLPFVDADGGGIARTLAARLAHEEGLRLRRVATADEARALVRDREAGAALVIPAGTSHALKHGRPAAIALYTDPVKYLELAEVRGSILELRHELERQARDRVQARLDRARAAALAARADLKATLRRARDEVAALAAALRESRIDLERELARLRRELDADLESAATVAAKRADAVRARVRDRLEPVRAFLLELQQRRREFDAWMAEVRKQAGRFADRIPTPPAMPVVPPDLATFANGALDATAADLVEGADAPLRIPSVPRLRVPDVPELPSLTVLALPLVPSVQLPGALAIEEASVTGAPRRLNTFDQNVPGFSVTFLLLGMLLGISMGLLDERDWGTLARLRAMPAPLATTLIGKLLARFAVGLAQMTVLFAVGRIAFGVSLGPEPWALALPTAGIVFAGTAFGLIVAGVAQSREAVLPVGSIVIVTMAAVGGCWWPIDLEPPWMRSAARLFPTTWAMAAFNDLMIRRQPLASVLRPTAVLFAYGALYLLIGLILFRRHVRRET